MTRIVKLRIDRLRLDRAAAGLTEALPRELGHALRTALSARRDGSTPDWPFATRPGLRQPAEKIAGLIPITGKTGKGGEG